MSIESTCGKCGKRGHGASRCPTVAASYAPESSFVCDGNLVYNLRQVGWRKGEPEMANDVAVTIQAHHLSPEIQADIANTICAELNRKYAKN